MSESEYHRIRGIFGSSKVKKRDSPKGSQHVQNKQGGLKTNHNVALICHDILLSVPPTISGCFVWLGGLSACRRVAYPRITVKRQEYGHFARISESTGLGMRSRHQLS